jgi:hypothetical protein
LSRILAVDPGKTTGYVIWDDGERVEGELYGEAFLDLAWEHLTGEEFDAVVCERFIINARTAKLTQSPWSLEQIGALRFMCKKFDIKFVLQNASDAKRFATDKKLNDLGWKRPKGDGHARDAQRHLLVYLISTGEVDAALLLKHDA